MKSFKDLLNEPLPSAMYEGDCGYDEDSELNDSELDPTVDNDYDDNEFDNDTSYSNNKTAQISEPEDDIKPLSPEADQRVDDTISAVATPLLINTELTESDIDNFIESVDSDIAVNEGFLTEKTIVKFDKNAKRAQLFEVAVAACAREHKDPLYKKLETVYKMERVIKAKLRKKYYSEAQRKVKEYLKRASKSKSNVIKRIAHKITGKK